MKVSAEKLPDNQVVLNIQAEPPEMEKYLARAYQRLVQRVAMPGFRKGKTPRPMLERYLGRGAFLEKALEDLLPLLYRQAVEEQGVEAIAEPEIEVLQADPVVFKATVAVRPPVELGGYRQLRIAPEPVEVTESDVDSYLEELRSLQAPWEPVERGAAFGDLITLDVEGTLGGKPFLESKGAQYLLVKGSTSPVPGFAERLEGLVRGQEAEFTLPLPQDNPNPELAGKEGLFRARVLEVKEKHLPPLDDELAKGEGFASLEALRQKVRENLRARAQIEVRRRLEGKVVEAVVEGAQVEPPPLLVQREVGHLLEEQRQVLRGSQLSLEDYLRNVKKSEEELRQELHPLARKRVLRSLVLGRVAEEEKIKVSPEEIEAEVEQLSQEAGEKGYRVREALSTPAGRSSLEQVMLTRKTLGRLVEIATASEPQPSPGDQKEEVGNGN